MESQSFYLIVADLMLLLHTLFVAFVVLGLLIILVGHFLSWSWVRNFWFRVLHLVAISIVTVQTWFGLSCPLTIWERALRARGGEETYQGAFIAHWLEMILYYQAPWWAFVLCYTAFAALVVATWYFIPPRRL